ncbi:MAG: replication-associated recombination protein A [Acidobacteriaceae bacterium]
MGLFANTPNVPKANERSRPLADRMRPRDLDEFLGQDQVIGPGKPLRLQIERDEPGSIIFWGPPGTGKTTLAQIIANTTQAQFIEFSAVSSGIKEVKQVMADAERAWEFGTRTVIFIDEIHRFNRAQQDAFLPYVERGTVRLIGATTEPPSFEINSALLSRCRVYTLEPLSPEHVVTLLERALNDSERGLGGTAVSSSREVLARIAEVTSGDARSALNVLEVAARTARQRNDGVIDEQTVADALQSKLLRYDKSGEEHYNVISALHKSVRNSDPDAALYWLTRMLQAGEDPLYVARRVVRMAVEDIGLASPQALGICVAAKDAMHFLGSPEGELALAQAVVYLALAPKSNAVYTAYGKVVQDVHNTYADPVPLHLRNAVAGLMKNIGYAKGYEYAHDAEDKLTGMQCLPEKIAGHIYYQPTNEGFEKDLRARLDHANTVKKKLRDAKKADLDNEV